MFLLLFWTGITGPIRIRPLEKSENIQDTRVCEFGKGRVGSEYGGGGWDNILKQFSFHRTHSAESIDCQCHNHVRRTHVFSWQCVRFVDSLALTKRTRNANVINYAIAPHPAPTHHSIALHYDGNYNLSPFVMYCLLSGKMNIGIAAPKWDKLSPREFLQLQELASCKWKAVNQIALIKNTHLQRAALQVMANQTAFYFAFYHFSCAWQLGQLKCTRFPLICTLQFVNNQL